MKKLLSLLLCLALLLSLTPAAFADDETPEEAAPVEEEIEAAPAEEAAEALEEELPAPEEEAPAAPADEPASEEENGKAEQDGEDEADDGPEYGVQPEEERTQSEEALQEDKQSEEEEAASEELSVLVLFSCDPQDTAVTIYEGTRRDDGSWCMICTVSGGKCLLLPGSYVYDAECDGYNSDYKVPFTVEVPASQEKGKQAEQIVDVTLFPLDEGALFEDEEEAHLPYRTTPPEPLIVLPVELDPARKTPTVFLQSDVRWAAKPYGYSDSNDIATIASAGCGILALTNAVYYLNGIFVEPGFAAEYSTSAGCHISGGTRWELYRNFAETYGMTCGIEYAGETNNYADLKNMLLRGCAAICSVPGHIMAIVDYDESLGRFLLLDSSPDDVRATGEGYVWISEQELREMPSRLYETKGLSPRFVLLRAVGLLDVNGLLDGTESDTLDGYGTFDVWIDGDKVANDQAEYSAVLPRGASYRIDDIRPKGAHRFYGVEAGALEGSVRSNVKAEIVLSFGTKDFVSERVDDASDAPAVESAPPAVCASWAGGVIGPALSLPLPRA